MKNFSLPRLVIVLWFALFVFSSLFSYLTGGARHEISATIVSSAACVVILVVGFGLVEDKF
ncbi:MAG TPA: hypothetical protein VK859_03915 [bacterium]|jgi:hypothetical protein|nr:hypothetical protein [bacterium]